MRYRSVDVVEVVELGDELADSGGDTLGGGSAASLRLVV